MERYLITGATGYIGSMLVKHIMSMNKEDIEITVIVRNIEKGRLLFDKLAEECLAKVNYICSDLADTAKMSKVEGIYDYIIHCASITKSAEMIAHPTLLIESIVNSTQNIMELAVRCPVKAVVYLSSMEVYGKLNSSDDCRVTEKELGALDILNVRNCYPMAKRMAENICYCYYKEFGVPVKIARLAQTFGAGILPGENRVFAQFALAAYHKQDIILHTNGSSVGNYCDIQDAINAVMLLLRSGIAGEAYNVVNEDNTMTIRQMAELVAKRIANDEIQVKFEIPEENIYGYAVDTGLRLSGEKLRKLGWQPTKDMEEMYFNVIEAIKETL